MLSKFLVPFPDNLLGFSNYLKSFTDTFHFPDYMENLPEKVYFLDVLIPQNFLDDENLMGSLATKITR